MCKVQRRHAYTSLRACLKTFCKYRRAFALVKFIFKGKCRGFDTPQVPRSTNIPSAQRWLHQQYCHSNTIAGNKANSASNDDDNDNYHHSSHWSCCPYRVWVIIAFSFSVAILWLGQSCILLLSFFPHVARHWRAYRGDVGTAGDSPEAYYFRKLDAVAVLELAPGRGAVAPVRAEASAAEEDQQRIRG